MISKGHLLKQDLKRCFINTLATITRHLPETSLRPTRQYFIDTLLTINQHLTLIYFYFLFSVFQFAVLLREARFFVRCSSNRMSGFCSLLSFRIKEIVDGSIFDKFFSVNRRSVWTSDGAFVGILPRCQHFRLNNFEVKMILKNVALILGMKVASPAFRVRPKEDEQLSRNILLLRIWWISYQKINQVVFECFYIKIMKV